MNLYELEVLLTMDKGQFDSALSESEGAVSSGTDAMVAGFANLATVGVAAIGEVTEKLIEFTNSAINAYADVEQSVGGIQKLFGNMGMTLEEYAEANNTTAEAIADEWQALEDAQNTVLANAKAAYKTAGMDYNTYMETATTLAASLIDSLDNDTQLAADQIDVAMTAISDNWNTFGGDIGSIIGAFKGFAKQNYTMLDNLKLGYGGTKTEMERLIEDANEYAATIGEASDLSIDSFSDIITAIELIQEKQNVAGTTAREATETISGSMNMMRAAFSNLVAGFADPDADVGALFTSWVETIVGGTDEAGEHINGAWDNWSAAFSRVGESIANLIPTILDSLVENAPSFIESGIEVIYSFGEGLVSSLLSVIEENGPGLVEAGLEWIGNLGEGLATGIPNFIGQALDLILEFSQYIYDNSGTFIEAGFDLLINIAEGLVSAIPSLIEKVPEIISNFANSINDNMGTVFEKGWELLVTIGQGLLDAIPTFLENLPAIFEAAWELWQAIDWLRLGTGVINFIVDGITALFNNIPGLLFDIATSAGEFFTSIDWIGLGKSAIELIKGGIVDLVTSIPSKLKEIGQTALEWFGNIDWLELGKSLILAIGNGILDMASFLVNTIDGLGSVIFDFFGNLAGSALTWGKDMISGFINGIKSMIDSVVSTVKGIASSIASFLGFSEPDEGPLSNFHTYAPDMMKLFAQGITDNADLLEDAFDDALGFTDKDIDVSATGNITGASSGTTTIGDVSIVVNAAEGQSAEEIAEAVMYRLQHIKDRQEAVFA